MALRVSIPIEPDDSDRQRLAQAFGTGHNAAVQASRAMTPRAPIARRRGKSNWTESVQALVSTQTTVRVEASRNGRALVLSLKPRQLTHLLIGVVVIAVTAASAVTRTTEATAIRSWIFEPFNSTLQSGDFLSTHPALGGGLEGGRSGLVNYSVQAGDTLSEIANRYGVSTQTVIWANDLSDVNLIQPGDSLRIPPVSGVLHTIVAGDKLPDLAQRYGVGLEQVLNYPLNKIQNPDELITGQVVLFPGGARPRPAQPEVSAANLNRPAAGGSGGGSGSPPPAVIISRGGRLGWPSGGTITQYFSGYHLGLDIGASYNSPIYAVESGTVIVATGGWNGGYGTVIDIDHGNGVVSRYSHLNLLYVQRGETVRKGQAIGTIGLTGITTGPHIHFEVLVNGRRVNPLQYLG